MKKLLKVVVFAAAAMLAMGIIAGCSSSSSSSAASSGSASSGSNTSASASASSASASGSASASSAAASDYKLVKDGTLTVIASLDFPPFENLENGEAVGFEVDLINEIGKRLNLTVDIQNKKFDAIVPAIAAGGSADLGVSGITITPEREEQVLFSDSVYDSNQAIVAMKDSGITDVSQLEGKTIAAQSGTTGSDWARENIKGCTVTDFDEVTACFAALQSGQADAVSIDLPVAMDMVKNAYQDAQVIKETPTGEQLGIAINKQNTALQSAINKALADMRSDGTYQKIYDKWFAA
jgi:polar amino acid transport system substrate-binding protein